LVTVAVVNVPVVTGGAHDARWLGGVIADLLERHYFDKTPALPDRVLEVAHELRQVANCDQPGDEVGSVRHPAA
jgi:hypothetical protein